MTPLTLWHTPDSITRLTQWYLWINDSPYSINPWLSQTLIFKNTRLRIICTQRRLGFKDICTQRHQRLKDIPGSQTPRLSDNTDSVTLFSYKHTVLQTPLTNSHPWLIDTTDSWTPMTHRHPRSTDILHSWTTRTQRHHWLRNIPGSQTGYVSSITVPSFSLIFFHYLILDVTVPLH